MYFKAVKLYMFNVYYSITECKFRDARHRKINNLSKVVMCRAMNHITPYQLHIWWLTLTCLFVLQKVLSFLNVDCSLVHNNVNVTSVFVDRAGEWKLGGVDFMYPASGPESIPPIKMFPLLEKYEPPERSGAGGKRPSEKWSVVVYLF